MKKYAMLMLAALLTISLSISAQDGQKKQRSGDKNRPRKEMKMTAKDRAEWMAKKLELTVDETAKVQSLLEKQSYKRAEQREAMKAKREQNSTNKTQNREEIKALREKEMNEFKSELEGIIGKAKMEKLSTLRKSNQRKAKTS